MFEDFFNTKKNRWWALLPLLALIWHGLYTAYYLHPHYLLFICYTANLLLGIGIIIGSGLLIGTGFGWTLIAFPLWLHYAVLNSDWEISGIAFHVCGILAGGLAVKDHRLPHYTWCAGVGTGLVLQLLSRMLTDEALNVNAAFRVYDGWEELFTNYTVYFLTMLLGFGVFFVLLTFINNRYLVSDHSYYERD